MAHFRLTLVSCCLTLVALGASSLACSDASDPNSRSRGNALEEGDKVECKADVVGDPGGSTCFEDEDLKKKAALTCEAAGLTLVDIGYASDCAGGSTYAKFACCGGEPPQPPEPTCFGDVVGDPGGTCNADEDLKLKASDACTAKGGVITEIAYASDCAGGSTYAKFECCVDKPEPPPSACTYDVVGSPDQGCNDNALLKEKAAGSCALGGLALTNIWYAEDCGCGFSSYAKYECCEGGEPPPPPNECKDGYLEGDCMDNALWKEKVSAECSAAGGTVTEVSYGEDCGAGKSSVVKYVCCVK